MRLIPIFFSHKLGPMGPSEGLGHLHTTSKGSGMCLSQPLCYSYGTILLLASCGFPPQGNWKQSSLIRACSWNQAGQFLLVNNPLCLKEWVLVLWSTFGSNSAQSWKETRNENGIYKLQNQFLFPISDFSPHTKITRSQMYYGREVEQF